MKYFRIVFPVLILIVCLMGMVVNYFGGNDAAFHAYLLAALGWLVLATDEISNWLDQPATQEKNV